MKRRDNSRRGSWACAWWLAAACGEEPSSASEPSATVARPPSPPPSAPVLGPAHTAHERLAAWEACLLRSVEPLEESVALWRARVRDDGTLRPGRRPPLAYVVDSELMPCDAAAAREPGSAFASAYVDAARALATLTVEVNALPTDARTVDADLSRRFVVAVEAFEPARDAFESELLAARAQGLTGLRTEIRETEGEGLRVAALDVLDAARGQLACAWAEPRQACGEELDALRTAVAGLEAAARGPTVVWQAAYVASARRMLEVAEDLGGRRRGGRERKDVAVEAPPDSEPKRRRTRDREAEERASVRAAFRHLWSDLTPLLGD